jgi:hypothetical protein
VIACSLQGHVCRRGRGWLNVVLPTNMVAMRDQETMEASHEPPRGRQVVEMGGPLYRPPPESEFEPAHNGCYERPVDAERTPPKFGRHLGPQTACARRAGFSPFAGCPNARPAHRSSEGGTPNVAQVHGKETPPKSGRGLEPRTRGVRLAALLRPRTAALLGHSCCVAAQLRRGYGGRAGGSWVQGHALVGPGPRPGSWGEWPNGDCR